MENNWIDINDRLPNPGEYVLVSFENSTLPDIGRYEIDSDGCKIRELGEGPEACNCWENSKRI